MLKRCTTAVRPQPKGNSWRLSLAPGIRLTGVGTLAKLMDDLGDYGFKIGIFHEKP